MPDVDTLHDNFLKEFNAWIELNKPFLKPDLENWLSFLLAKLPAFDIDCKGILVGTTRIGKSTQFLQYVRRITAAEQNTKMSKADQYLLDSHFVTEKIIYSPSQTLDKYKKYSNDILGFDETYLTFDRRNAMAQSNINLTQYLDVYASKKNRVFALAQDLTDLDQRVLNKASFLVLDYERGSGLLFAKSRNFPIIKQTFNFEKLQKYPRLIQNKEVGIANFRHVMGYIGKIHWNDLSGHALYREYKSYKEFWQEKLI
ncbi:MAG: hypothetical protein QXL94_06645 [Candidatus Parvarchaeum sp.]